MSATPAIAAVRARLEDTVQKARRSRVLQSKGRVVQLIGLVIESEGPLASVGEVCQIVATRSEGTTLAEVVGFRGHHLLLMPLGETHGIHPGCEVIASGAPMQVPVSAALKGRVIDSFGQPLDNKGPIVADHMAPLNMPPPHPLHRQRISKVFQTGIKALDTFTPCGRGQRMGIFAGSGVGKSTLLGMIARQAEADVNVIALIGERGREVREFLEKDLGEKGLARSVIVVATSNQPALARLKGAFLAMAIAEYYRDNGANVLLMMDSVTRFAMAQREIGLAIGEPPTTRGYTPSVFSLLPQLLERAGMGAKGSITGLFTVLVEADDMNDPIGDTVRSILDGHIVLSRELAALNHYPAIEVLDSVSRLTRDLLQPDQLKTMSVAREMLAVFRKNQDLINLGAYPAGSNPVIDQAIRLHGPLTEFLRQPVDTGFATAQSWAAITQAISAAPAAPAPAAKAK